MLEILILKDLVVKKEEKYFLKQIEFRKRHYMATKIMEIKKECLKNDKIANYKLDTKDYNPISTKKAIYDL